MITSLSFSLLNISYIDFIQSFFLANLIYLFLILGYCDKMKVDHIHKVGSLHNTYKY